MADIAALNLAVNSDSVEQANVALREMPKAASAAERATQKYSATTMNAANSNEQFSKRTNAAIKSLEFERAQLLRSRTEREKYNALRKAGVAAASAEGQAITASVAALQAQRAAATSAAQSQAKMTSAVSGLTTGLKGLVLAYVGIAAVQKLWAAGMRVGDLGEQADQIGVTTAELQAFRYAANQAGIETEAMDGAMTKLQKAMGGAADGGKEQVELFNNLGVKLLDVHGELRPVADVLPEVARGVLGIGSSSQRTATLMELFGKSGAKMATVLEDIAKGSDEAVAAAKKAGAVASPEVIKAWDDLGDALIRTGATADVTIAKLGAPIATAALTEFEKVLKRINETMDQINSKEGFWQSILKESRESGRMGGLRLETDAERTERRRAELNAELKNPNNAGRENMIQEDLNQLNKPLPGGPAAGTSRIGREGGWTPARSTGKGSPAVKASGGGSDPYKSAIESAKEYVLAKNAETAAVGLSVIAAARLTHEQGLLNKAQTEGKTVSAAQKVEIASLAQAMAEADAKLATAKFMDDATKKSEEFIASQKIEQEALFMSAQAAMAYKFEQEALNRAKADGIILTDQEKQKLAELANAQAAVQQKTNDMKDAISFAKDVTKGFFDDIRQGAEEGKSALEIFGNAFLNVLDKIASKLMDMAINDLFSGGNSSGGFFSAIGSILSNVLGSAVGSANGNVFDRGNVIPFARGGIVGGPTVFPMARGIGLMGEAGPEAIMPLRRGRNGSLGVTMNGGGGGQPVVVYVTGDTDLVRVTANNEAVKVVTAAAPKIESSAVSKSTKAVPSAVAIDHAERGGDYRT